jgi:hypothetical protein
VSDNGEVTAKDPALELTRYAWHAVAELVLAGPQHRRGGGIRLRVVPGGFATTRELDLRVVGLDVVLSSGSVPINGRTCRDLATAAGVEVGEPHELYHDGSHADPDEVLELDDDHAEELSRAYETGEAALRRFAPTETPVLWPEHFDVAIRVDGVNYGVSPGDAYLGVPYAYVGPDTHGPEPYWNAPFGATVAVADLADVNAVVAFFAEGRHLARSGG